MHPPYCAVQRMLTPSPTLHHALASPHMTSSPAHPSQTFLWGEHGGIECGCVRSLSKSEWSRANIACCNTFCLIQQLSKHGSFSAVSCTTCTNLYLFPVTLLLETAASGLKSGQLVRQTLTCCSEQYVSLAVPTV